MSDQPGGAADFEGDPRHPDHDSFLLELGRATYAAALLAGVCFDIIRAKDKVPSSDMYQDVLGKLEKRLREKAESDPLPGLPEFLKQLESARRTRNDLLHAFPVRDGLRRQVQGDCPRVRDFFTVAAVREATEELQAARVAGSSVLYHDGGEMVRAWLEGGGS